MSQASATLYGRSPTEWDELTAEGRRFLVEQARLQRRTTYTELNTVLRQRTSVRTFDFDLDSERAAMGHLLYLIVESERPTSGTMISAIVIYLNENDAGSGFYTFARELGLLDKKATPDQKLVFWTQQVSAVHAYYRNH